MGIDLEVVALDRFDGVTVYRIGDKALHTPKLLIEKKRFLPLFLSYMPPMGSRQEVVEVRLGDYRKMEGAWHPYHVSYVGENGLEERYLVLDLKLNVPVESPPREAPELSLSKEEQGSPEQKSMKELIRVFRQKYP